jgi:cystathionine beta-synthase
MRDKGFDQLPVASSSHSHRLVGLVTLGNLLSYISSGRADANDPVRKVMFDFTTLHETITDPTDISLVGEKAKQNQSLSLETLQVSGNKKDDKKKAKTRPFVEITRDTKLSALSRFFEWNSAAVVTEKQSDGSMKPVAVVTKVDLLSWMVRMKKHQEGGSNGAP